MFPFSDFYFSGFSQKKKNISHKITGFCFTWLQISGGCLYVLATSSASKLQIMLAPQNNRDRGWLSSFPHKPECDNTYRTYFSPVLMSFSPFSVVYQAG